MKKILVIIHPHLTIAGGAGKVVLEVGERLSERIRVVLIAQQIRDEYKKQYPHIEFVSLNGPLTSSFRFWLLFPWWQLQTFLQLDKYRQGGEMIMLCSVFPAQWIGLPYKLFHRNVKTIWFCQEPSAFIHSAKWRKAITDPFKRLLSELLSGIFGIIDVLISRLADVLLANSRFSARYIKDIYNRDSVIAHPGIDTEKCQAVPYVQKENYILSVCRLSKFKNVDVLIRAFAQLSDTDVRLKIVGDGEEKDMLQSLVRALHLEKRVDFLGGISDDDLIKCYAQAKVFVLCSKEEPFGIVPVEAMACGTAVIADRSGGVTETVVDGETGLLIDCAPGTLAKALDSLLLDSKRLKLFSEKAVVRAKDNFSWENCAKRIGEII